MKIGILTQPLGCNYGGNIQNWALQHVLTNMGHKPVTINICRKNGVSLRNRWWAIKDFCFAIIKRYLRGNYRKHVNNPFSIRYTSHEPLRLNKEFRAKIAKTNELTLQEGWQNKISLDSYEAFIVGSDQVWKQEYSPNITTYFLDFLSPDDSRLRIAYAASFGNDTPIKADRISACRELLKRFDAVSVRESSALDILKNTFDYDKAIKTLDPTLLLKAEDYLSLVKDSDHTDTFVGIYILDKSEDKERISEDIKENFGIYERGEIDTCKKCHTPTMSEWLAMFADSKFVFTDSFHGCVFSIIFHKPFVAIANEYRGLDRFLSLLEETGLTNRLVFNYDEYQAKKSQLLSSIDWEAVEAKLQEQRKKSLAFLRDALGE